jgi:hypothetical protein
MKHLILAVGLFAALACSRLDAQTAHMEASIPFNFRVAANAMPAGDYTIHQSGGVLTLSQVGGRTICVLTLPASRPSAPSTGVLEFHRYGDTYFLSSVWTPQSAEGRSLPKGSQEKELARRLGIGPIQAAALKTK